MGTDPTAAPPAREPEVAARALLEHLGPHPWTTLGAGLDDEVQIGRWLVLACLLSAVRDERRALDAFADLAELGLDSPGDLAGAPAGAAAPALEARGVPRAERVAHQLSRACRALEARHGGSLDTLAGESESLESLGGRLAALGPGIGRATVIRFLRPLRARWPAAAEVPLDPAAHAAALHLGWLDAGDDLEGAPGALGRRLDDLADPPALCDVESALERLGRRACLRERADRCPMGASCPLRGGSAAAG